MIRWSASRRIELCLDAAGEEGEPLNFVGIQRITIAA
jgi:hypothetical protein